MRVNLPAHRSRTSCRPSATREPQPRTRPKSARPNSLDLPPALLPFFFADQTGHPGLFLGGWDDPVLRREARNFENKLGPDRFLEFFAIFDRHDEGTRPSDHADLVIAIQILDIDRIGWLLHHNRQPVDDDALLQRGLARAGPGG